MSFETYFSMSVVPWYEVCIRVGLAIIFGLILGLDRDTKNKPIDFRAYIIIAATTCIIAIMGQELYGDYSNAKNFVSLDLGKIISGVLTGIGFLGAGAIIKRQDDHIIGTATGASVWASGGIGLTLGFGFYGLAFFGFGVVALTLILGGYCMSTINGRSDKEKKKK